MHFRSLPRSVATIYGSVAEDPKRVSYSKRDTITSRSAKPHWAVFPAYRYRSRAICQWCWMVFRTCSAEDLCAFKTLSVYWSTVCKLRTLTFVSSFGRVDSTPSQWRATVVIFANVSAIFWVHNLLGTSTRIFPTSYTMNRQPKYTVGKVVDDLYELRSEI